MRKSFMFYLSWKTQLDVLSDKEHRRFINNLIKWHLNEDVELKSKSDLLFWAGILPALEVNNEKWHRSAERSIENGKKSTGRPPKPKITQQVIEEPTKPVKSKELNVKSKKSKENSKMENDNSELKIDNSQNVNSGMTTGNYYKNKINELTTKLVVEYPQYPFLISMANPTGIRELKNHIENKQELDSITQILNELASSKKNYKGSYD